MSSAHADQIDGQDGRSSLKDYKIPKKTRKDKYDYRESSKEESDTDPYEVLSSDIEESEAEDGEIAPDDAPAHGTKWFFASEEEYSDTERFNPLDKSDELLITGSMARYVNKYFNTYVILVARGVEGFGRTPSPPWKPISTIKLAIQIEVWLIKS